MESPPHPPLRDSRSSASAFFSKNGRQRRPTLSPQAGRGEVDTPPHSRGAIRPSCACNFRPRNQRAQGMPGAWCARSRACSVESTRVSHHGHTGNTRHSPRSGFNGFLRALPGDRACLPPSPGAVSCTELDASVGASGPHDFAVRLRRPVFAPSASTASRPAFVTNREYAPLWGRTA